MSKNTRIGRELAYIIAKLEQIYLSPNCCFNGSTKPTDEELGKMLIEPGCRVMTCPRCNKKLIVARRGTESEFNKVDIYEWVSEQELKTLSLSAECAVATASKCNSFDDLSTIIMPSVMASEDLARKQSHNEGFISGMSRTIRGLFPLALKKPSILQGKNH